MEGQPKFDAEVMAKLNQEVADERALNAAAMLPDWNDPKIKDDYDIWKAANPDKADLPDAQHLYVDHWRRGEISKLKS